MGNWEYYRFFEIDDVIVQGDIAGGHADEMGRDGWELVTAWPVS